MRKLALLLLASLPVFAQTDTPPPAAPPDPPACLSAPVTKGTVTLSCSMIDATGGADNLITASGGYLFGVKAVSSDPDVNTVQIQITVLQSMDPNATPTAKRAVTILKSTAGTFAYVFYLNPSFDASGKPFATGVLTIVVDEMKPTSSQSF